MASQDEPENAASSHNKSQRNAIVTPFNERLDYFNNNEDQIGRCTRWTIYCCPGFIASSSAHATCTICLVKLLAQLEMERMQNRISDEQRQKDAKQRIALEQAYKNLQSELQACEQMLQSETNSRIALEKMVKAEQGATQHWKRQYMALAQKRYVSHVAVDDAKVPVDTSQADSSLDSAPNYNSEIKLGSAADMFASLPPVVG